MNLSIVLQYMWPSVVKEPIVREADPSSSDASLSAARSRCGVTTEVLFDIRIIDTDVPSYKHRTPETVHESAAIEKMIYQMKIDVVNSQPYLFQ